MATPAPVRPRRPARVARASPTAGRLALALLLAAPLACAPPGDDHAAAPVRGVVLVTVDTLRADSLGAYGSRASATPRLDAFARDAVVFERAYSQATLTHPALASMLTGLQPGRHGVEAQAGRMRDGVVSLAVLLAARGIETGAFVANMCKLQDHAGTVFHDGWDRFFCGMQDDVDGRELQYAWDEAVVTAGLDWIAERRGPFLAWIHLMDPHASHHPPPDLWDHAARPVRRKTEQYEHMNQWEMRREFPPADELQRLHELYAAEVAGVDRQVGRLLDGLAALPGGDGLAVLFASDHGEELYETWSRYDHGLSLTEGVLWVPLMLRVPGRGAARVGEPVELLQVTPTVLELFGLAPAHRLDGPSLLDERPGPAVAFSSVADIAFTARTREHRYWWRATEAPWTRPANNAPWRAEAPWFQHRECLARYPEPAPTRVEWLDPRSPDHDDVAIFLRAAIHAQLAAGRAPAQEIDDPALREQLRALGY